MRSIITLSSKPCCSNQILLPCSQHGVIKHEPCVLCMANHKQCCSCTCMMVIILSCIGTVRHCNLQFVSMIWKNSHVHQQLAAVSTRKCGSEATDELSILPRTPTPLSWCMYACCRHHSTTSTNNLATYTLIYVVWRSPHCQQKTVGGRKQHTVRHLKPRSTSSLPASQRRLQRKHISLLLVEACPLLRHSVA